jgi:hypothetical protein
LSRESTAKLTFSLSLSAALFGIILLSSMLFCQRYKKTPWDHSLISQNDTNQ